MLGSYVPGLSLFNYWNHYRLALPIKTEGFLPFVPLIATNHMQPTAFTADRMSSTHEKTDNYPRLSRPFESMKPEYDVVVVGSGYGAGIAASRMARAGKTVAVLELGWERRCTNLPSRIKSLDFENINIDPKYSWVIPIYIVSVFGRHECFRNLCKQ